MPLKSRYVLIVDNLSSVTRSADIKYEMESSRDADDAWRKADGMRIDGRGWRIEWATEVDFRHFGWRWTEGRGRSPTPVKRRRSPSPSPSPSRSLSRSRSPGAKHKDDKEDSARGR